MNKKRSIELGPLSLSKTQYKPYLASNASKGKENTTMFMDTPLSLMLDMPPAQQAQRELPHSPQTLKLRTKIEKYLSKEGERVQEQWAHYVDKAEVFKMSSSQWGELEIYLLKIINSLISQQLTLKQRLNEASQAEEKQYVFHDHGTLDATKIYESQYHTQLKSKVSKSRNILDLGSHSSNDAVGRPKFNRKIIDAGVSPKSSQENALLKLEITKLRRKADMYEEKLGKAKAEYELKVKGLQQKISEQLKEKYGQFVEEKIKYENQADNKKFHNEVLLKQYIDLKDQYARLDAELKEEARQKSEAEKQKSGLKGLLMYKELWMMQGEEIYQLKQIIHKLKQDKENEQKKSGALKLKLKEISRNFNYNENIFSEDEKDKNNLNKIMKDFQEWLKFIAVPRVSKGMMNANTYFPEMKVHDNELELSSLLPKDDEINYRLLRPNFFIYFEAYETIIAAEKKFPQKKLLPPDFLLTIRAILDAMYLHFNFTPNFEQWKNFPEFAMSFIEQFEIHPQLRKPVLRKTPCQGPQKIEFVLNAFNLGAANSWECEMFRGFLMEEFTLDEIYFFLQCRNSIFKGSVLNSNYGAADSVCLVQVEVAEHTVREKLRDYDKQMLDRIRKFLNSKKKVKLNRSFVDANFVLKILLEVYSIEKIKSERFFHHNFKSKSSEGRINYPEYSAFMTKNFKFLTKGEMAKLYREIYTLGVGRVTYKTIHFVCSMRGLFIPLLRQKLVRNRDKTDIEDPVFLDLQNLANNVAVDIESFGVEQVAQINLKIHDFLKASELLRKNRDIFESRFFCEAVRFEKIKALYSWKSHHLKRSKQMSREEVRERMSQFFSVAHHVDKDLQNVKRQRGRRGAAITKLTRNFKIRIQQSMEQFKVFNNEEYGEKLAKICELPDRQNKQDQEPNKSKPSEQSEL